MATTAPYVPSTAPIRKRANIPDDARAPTRYDSIPLAEEEVEGGRLEFFQPNPTQDIHKNYRDNPFQGSSQKQIIGVGFSLSVPVVEEDSANNIDTTKIVQAVQHSGVTIAVGDRKQTKYRSHMSQFVNFSGSKPVNESGFTAYHLKSEGIRLLEDPREVVLQPDQRFHLTTHLRDSYQLPAASEWDSTVQPTTRLVARIQYIE